MKIKETIKNLGDYLTNKDEEEYTAPKLVIKDFFDEQGYKISKKGPLLNLKEDNKDIKEPDFYLPTYKVYVEYVAMNTEEYNKKLEIKKEAYRKNKIPCVFLYWNQLSYLKYAFKRQIRKVFEYHKMKKESFLFEFRNIIYNSRYQPFFFIIVAIAGYLSFKSANWVCFFIALAIYPVIDWVTG